MDWIFRKEKEKPILYSVKFSELKRDELSENLPKTKFVPFDSGATQPHVTVFLTNGIEERYVFENGIISGSFSRRNDIASIVISSGVTTISRNAFSNCQNLTSVTVSSTVTKIMANAFSGCTSLSSVTFNSRRDVKKVKILDSKVFCGCTSLTRIVIPYSVEEIGEGCFSGCTNLASVVFEENSVLNKVGTNSFRGCTSLESVMESGNTTYDASTNIFPKSLTIMGSGTFNGCSSLQNFIISNSITSFGTYSFANCTNLKTVKFEEGSQLETIPSYCFDGCTNLTTINLPNTINYINPRVFNKCTSLEEIELGENIRQLSTNVFSDCSSLNKIICNSPTRPTIYNNTFYNVKTGGTLYYPEGSDYSLWLSDSKYYLGYYEWKDGNATGETIEYNVILTLVDGSKEKYRYDEETPMEEGAFSGRTDVYTVEIRSGVTDVSNSAFSNCTALKGISIGEDVKNIGDAAFRGCTALTDVSFDSYSGLTTIGDRTFYNCQELTSFIVPGTVSTIGTHAFYNCRKLEEIHLSDELTEISGSTFGRCVSLETIVIPKNVTTVGVSAFDGCSYLKNVTFKTTSALTIGNTAFKNCSALTSVQLPENDVTLGISTFEGCTSLFEIALKVIKKTGKYCFKDCNALVNIKLDNIEELSYGSFRYCTGITSVVIGEDLTTIGEYAFANCTSLVSINFKNINTIEKYAFYSCTNLESIVIPNSLVTIEYGAFSHCSNLTGMTIGSGLTTIYDYVFSSCSKLGEITIYCENHPKIYAHTFYSIKEGGTLIYPEGSDYSAWLSDSKYYLGYYNWNYDDSQYTLTIMVNGEVYETLRLNAGDPINITTPSKEGYSFNWDSEIPETMPEENLTIYGTFTINQYTLTLTVDGQPYTSFTQNYNTTISVSTPSKEGYSFAWESTIPSKMPARNTTINGVFTINQYTLKLTVGNQPYTSITQDYGTVISVTNPTRVGYTFAWDREIPATMPSRNMTINGRFTVNQYTLKLIVDGQTYTSITKNYGASISVATPTKEGYSFAWESAIPSTMPAQNTTINGHFTINQYTLTLTVDGQPYTSFTQDYGTAISFTNPTKVGYTLTWSRAIPATMPAENLTINGTFTVNRYTLTLTVGGQVYTSLTMNYGAAISVTDPEQEGYRFAWDTELPETMPAQNLTINGTFTVNQYTLTLTVSGGSYTAITEYTSITQDYGTEISVTKPTQEGYYFRWETTIPATMPAENLTINGIFYRHDIILTLVGGTEEGILLNGNTVSGEDGISGRSDVVSVEFVNTDIKKITESAFRDCTGIEEITIPSGVTEILASSFMGCTSLENVTFAEGSQLNKLGQNVFNGCTSLGYIELGENLRSIGSGAFNGCTSLSTIVINENNNQDYINVESDSFSNVSKTGVLIYPKELDYSTWIQEGYYLEGWIAINSENIIIDENYDDGDYEWHYLDENVQIITGNTEIDGFSVYSLIVNGDSDNVIKIYDNIIHKLPEDETVTSITIPSAITMLGSSAFTNLTNLEEVTFEENSQLKTINTYAFGGCSKLESIVIPSNVETIMKNAFSGCTSVTSLTFEENSKLSTISSNTFNGLTSLKLVELPSGITKIEQSAFTGCVNIEIVIAKSTTAPRIYSLSFPNLVSSAERTLYYPSGSDYSSWSDYFNILIDTDNNIDMNDEYLGDLTTGTYEWRYLDENEEPIEGFTEIDTNTISDISININKDEEEDEQVTVTVTDGLLYNLDIEDKENIIKFEVDGVDGTVTKIGKEVFTGFTSVGTINLGEMNGLEIIDKRAFNGCTLTEITLPASLKYVNTTAFENCENMDTVNMLGTTPPSLSWNSISNIPLEGTITIPNGANINNWETFRTTFGEDWSLVVRQE